MTTRSSAASTQNNTTSMFGTGGGLFGNKTSSNTFGSTSNQQGSTGMFGSVLQPSNLNNSNTNNGGLFSQNPNDAQKAQTGMFGSSLNLGKENTTTNGGLTSGLRGWKAAGAQIQSVFGSQASGSGLGFASNPNPSSMTNNFMGGGASANGNSNIIPDNGTVGYTFNLDNLSKNKDNIHIYTLTGVQVFREKTLEELRGEDYKSMKNNTIPDQRMMELKNIWQNSGSSHGAGGSTNLLSMITANPSQQQVNPSLNSFSQNSTNSLFGGNQSQQTKPSTPVFGASSNPTLASINFPSLGASSQQQINPNNQGGGLLGNTQNNGGLGSSSMFTGLAGAQSQFNGFGGSTNTQQNQSQTQNQNQGGLFGGNGNSLLGAQNQNKPIGLTGNPLLGGATFNNTFGGLGNTQNTTGGAQNPMFGNSSNNNTQGGLFNSNSNNQNSNTGGGLFSSINQNAQQQSAPATNNGLASSSSVSSVLAMTQNSLNSITNNNQQQGTQSSSILGQISQNTFSGLGQAPINIQQASKSASAMNGLEFSFADSSFDTENWQPEVAVKQYDLFGNTFGYKAEGGSVRHNYPYNNNEIIFARAMNSKFSQNPFDNERKRSSYQSAKTLREFKRPYTHLKETQSLRIKPDQNDIFMQTGKSLKRVMRYDYDSEQNIEKKNNADYARFFNYITIYVAFNKDNENEEAVYTFDVGLHDTFSEVKNHVLKQVLNSEGLNCVGYKMLYNQKILKEKMSVQEVGLKDREKIYLIPDYDFNNMSNSEDSTNLSEASRKCLAPEDLIPVIPKNFKTVPQLVKLSRMSEEELANIQDFSVYNENARITFPGTTDIRGINLGELVNLGYRSVEVYPQNCGIQVPRAGEGLNKKAVIEFYNWPLPRKYENQVSEYTTKLKRKFSSLNAEYKKYDVSRQSLTVTVQNFC